MKLNMREHQTEIPVTTTELLTKVKSMLDDGYRLVQIGCTALANNELTYTFDKDRQLTYFKLIVASENAVIPSVSPIYWNAFLYENELHDLFGITFTDLALDYQGKFYRLAKKFPFAKQTATTTDTEEGGK